MREQKLYRVGMCSDGSARLVWLTDEQAIDLVESTEAFDALWWSCFSSTFGLLGRMHLIRMSAMFDIEHLPAWVRTPVGADWHRRRMNTLTATMESPVHMEPW